MMKHTRGLATAAIAMALLTVAAASAQPGGKTIVLTPAGSSPIATQAAVLGAVRVGRRLVTVGDRGTILLSDDEGVNWRQARQVPVDSLRGWAVGHWGVVLVTEDGGETWKVQRSATAEDRPLLSVHFLNAQQGVAVGLWSLVLATSDGGKTWVTQAPSPPPGGKKADLNLLHLFADSRGVLYATAERGFVLRSDDQGKTRSYLTTGYRGTFWNGMALEQDVLLVGGQRGTLYRSSNAGRDWTRVETSLRSSITSMARTPQSVMVVGLDGMKAVGQSDSLKFEASYRPDRVAHTAVLPKAGGGWLMWSKQGFLQDRQP